MISSMKKEESPGADGLPVRYCKEFVDLIVLVKKILRILTNRS